MAIAGALVQAKAVAIATTTDPKVLDPLGLVEALWAFLRYWRTPEECVIRAVGFGGDTDTIGAMAGALVGALHGGVWIPARWYENIENGPHGRDEIVILARRLASLSIP